MFTKLNDNCPPGVFLFLLLCLGALPFLAGFLPIVRFPQEQIDIHVFPDHIRVRGVYVYENPFPFPVTQGFSIPFHRGPQYPPPVHIRAMLISPTVKPLSLLHALGKHRFELSFSPHQAVAVEVSYSQAAPARSGYYLLRTTKPWIRPLSAGTYRLILNGVDLVASNYPVSRVEDHVFAFSKENFMPEMDWQWKWKVKENEGDI